jgi:ParB family chromosome partitioning protein
MTEEHKQPSKEDVPYVTALLSKTVPSGNTIQSVKAVAIEKIVLPPQQLRHYFEPEKMQELVASLRQHGILDPLLVRPLDNQTYELVSGERRYRAAKAVEMQEVPVVVRQLSNEEALQIALIENLQREDLNPAEETQGIVQLLAIKLKMEAQDIPLLLYKMQHEAKGRIAQNVLGNSQGQVVQEVFRDLGLMSWKSFVSSRLPLLKLPAEILEALHQGKIAYTKAQVLAKVKAQEQRQALLEEVIAKTLSLAQIKQRITSNTVRLSQKPDRLRAIAQMY